MARPTILTKALVKTMAEARAQGMPIRDICGKVGVTERIYYRWHSKGLAEVEADDHPLTLCGEFVQELAKAEARRVARLLASVDRGVEKDPKLALDVVSRMRPNDYGLRSRTELTGANGGPVEVAGKLSMVDVVREVEEEERQKREAAEKAAKEQAK